MGVVMFRRSDIFMGVVGVRGGCRVGGGEKIVGVERRG